MPRFLASVLLLMIVALPAMADDVVVPYRPQSFGEAMGASVVFGLVGILVAIFGFKMFDWMTPGNLQKEVFENNKMAPAVLAAAMILGTCIIMAAAVH